MVGSAAKVMKQYNPGPSGGILKVLNLFMTNIFDQVLGIIEKCAETVESKLRLVFVVAQRAPDTEVFVVGHVILNLPGQIEIFTCSASGAIITDAIASSLPTIVAYISRPLCTAASATFMSNVLCVLCVSIHSELVPSLA